MSEIGERIKQFRTIKKIKIKDIVKKTGVPRTNYYRYENGKAEVDINFVSLLVQNFPVRAYWLLTGNEPMEWKGQGDREISSILEKVLADDFLKKTLYNFLEWQEGLHGRRS